VSGRANTPSGPDGGGERLFGSNQLTAPFLATIIFNKWRAQPALRFA